MPSDFAARRSSSSCASIPLRRQVRRAFAGRTEASILSHASIQSRSCSSVMSASLRPRRRCWDFDRGPGITCKPKRISCFRCPATLQPPFTPARTTEQHRTGVRKLLWTRHEFGCGARTLPSVSREQLWGLPLARQPWFSTPAMSRRSSSLFCLRAAAALGWSVPGGEQNYAVRPEPNVPYDHRYGAGCAPASSRRGVSRYRSPEIHAKARHPLLAIKQKSAMNHAHR